MNARAFAALSWIAPDHALLPWLPRRPRAAPLALTLLVATALLAPLPAPADGLALAPVAAPLRTA